MLFVAILIVGAVSELKGHGPLGETFVAGKEDANSKIAIISVEGAILDGDGFVKQQIDAVRKDDSVRAVVLRVNSPGGTVTASDFIYHHLQKLKEDRNLPIVVSMGSVAASGGYYVAMAVGNEQDCIYAEPTTWTGSIGVIIPHYNVGGLMKHWEIEEDSIKSGPLKEMGTITRAMTPEERKVFEELVASSFARFQSIVKSGRPKLAADPEALAKMSTGQVFTTEQAIAGGLVDKEGFLEAAVDRAAELASLGANTFRVVKYKKPGGFLGVPMAESARAPDLATIVDLASPRAYYLFTWMPGMTDGK